MAVEKMTVAQLYARIAALIEQAKQGVPISVVMLPIMVEIERYAEEQNPENK